MTSPAPVPASVPVPAARRTSPLITAAALAAVCCLVPAGCKTTKTAKGPTVMDNRQIVPAPYVGPRLQANDASAAVAEYHTPVSSTPAEIIPEPIISGPPVVAVAPPPRVTPAPALISEKPVVSLPPPVTPAPTIKPVRIIEKSQTREPMPATSSKAVVYTVKQGDNLWDIGRAYGVSVPEICDHANIDANKVLKIGQKIELPAGAHFIPESDRPKLKKSAPPIAKITTSRPATTATTRNPTTAIITGTAAAAGPGKYVVQKGDSLWTIARANNTGTKELMALNNLTNDRLMPGQILTVSGNAQTVAVPAPASAPPAVITVSGGNAGNSNTGSTGAVATQPVTIIDVNAGVIKNSSSNAAVPPTPVAAGSGATKNLPHFVVDGDSLANIAEMYGSKVDWIKRENATIKSDADLKPGTRISVPVQDIER